MTTYQKGELVLVGFPFSGGSQVKLRPALVVLDTGDEDVLLARVTTQLHSTPYDIALGDWQTSGLLAASVVRLHKLATLDKRLIRRTLGQIQPADRTTIATALQRAFANW